MNIISHAAQAVQPTTKYRVEERTIDAAGRTTGRDRILTADDLPGGWDLFRKQLTRDPARYAPGTGRRLVLKGGGR